LRIESTSGWNAAQTDLLTVQNTVLAGIRNDLFRTDVAGVTSNDIRDWYLAPARNNSTLTLAADLKLVNPFSFTNPNFNPTTGSPVFNASNWYGTAVEGLSIDNRFFDRVNYIGAFDTEYDWTEGWAEWNPVNKDYPAPTQTKGNGVFTLAGGLKITADETWSGVILLDGWVYVESGATLNILPGTIIRGTETSALVITKGGKINAAGTKESPIVFTSSQGAGLRSTSDWGGVVICGKGIVNTPSGEKIAEGGVGVYYGGTDNADNSGVMRYVRIEFPGFEVATGSELNGLSMCAVGSGTKIEYVQVSYSGDDGFEWWGGAVNAKYLISYKTEDDDFDTDNGFSGMIQYGLILRDSEIVDTDTANGFESDNDDTGTDNTPYTHAIFSNISAFGPSISKY
jgi:hypothetical protein